MPPAAATFRPATHQDFDFAWQLFSTEIGPIITPHLQRGWCAAAEKGNFAKIWHLENTTIVEIDAVRVGWFAIHETRSSVVLENIFLVPRYQRKGIGSGIVRNLVEDAKQNNKSVSVCVLKRSTTAAFYNHLGFRVCGEDSLSLKMTV